MGDLNEFSLSVKLFLNVPFKHGYPLDMPNDPRRQHAVIEAALKLLEEPTLTPPVLADFPACLP